MNKLKVEYLEYIDLSNEDKKEVKGYDWTTFLRISDNDKTVYLTSDLYPKEDFTYEEDFDWLPNLVNAVYSYGDTSE